MAVVQAPDELLLHTQAYLQLFQAVLRNNPADQNKKNAILQDLRVYINLNIQSPDEFISHIAEFAKKLGVSEAALGNYIGSNFVKALSMVKQQALQKQQTAAAATPKPAARASSKSIIQEILNTFGPLLPDGGRFIEMDMGVLKLVTQNGEILPTSVTGVVPSSPGTGGSPSTAAPTSFSSASPGQSAMSSGDSAPGMPSQSQEAPFIKEILEKFGNILDIPGKLEVRDDSDPSLSYDDDEEGDEQEGVPSRRESSIIKEIIEKFGNVIDIPGKLVPESDKEEGFDSGDDLPDDEEEEAEYEETVIPLPFDFEQYIDTVKKIQEFQAAGNQTAYRTWLDSASQGSKAYVAIRNKEYAEKNGRDVNWEEEFYNLSHHLACTAGQLKELQGRFRKFEQLQKVLQHLTNEIRTKDPNFVNAVKKIWPQLRLMFQMEAEPSSMNSQLKIVLLQIPDPELKNRITQMMQNYFQKLYQIHHSQ